MFVWKLTHLLRGEGSGVVSFPSHTSSIFVRTFLINAALLRMFSLVERLATVDNGWGLVTETGSKADKKILPQCNTDERMKWSVCTLSEDGGRVLIRFCTFDGQLPLSTWQHLPILIHDGVSRVGSFLHLRISITLQNTAGQSTSDLLKPPTQNHTGTLPLWTTRGFSHSNFS